MRGAESVPEELPRGTNPPTMRAQCAFPGCHSAIIEITEPRTAQLPPDALESFQLMQRPDSKLGQFVIVDDVWDFDNIGVSKDLPNQSKPIEVSFNWNNKHYSVDRCIKYLICADCDRGPIGVVVHTKENQQLYILSLDSTSSK